MSADFTPTVRCIACVLTILLVAYAQAGEAGDTPIVHVTDKSAKTARTEGLKLTGVWDGDGRRGVMIRTRSFPVQHQIPNDSGTSR